MFFATIMRQLGHPFRILSVDVDQETIREPARHDPNIELLASSSTEPKVAERIRQLRVEYPGPVFAILDSLHTAEHVLAEMKLLRPLLTAGDYLIVEDSNINGHPVLPGWGPGPYEALEAYEREFPDDYRQDRAREEKFGFTFATNGFLVRRSL
jgi:cephalosporin hydroxylase